MWTNDIDGVLQRLEELRVQGVTDFRAYFEAHPESIPTLMDGVRIIDINDEGLALFGARSTEELERSIHETMTPESLPATIGIIVALTEGREQYECETVRRSLQGDIRTVIVRVSFPAQPGEGMLVSSVDITERKRAEERIRQLNADLAQRAAELQAANVELEAFSYSVSHDLRAPLRAMDGYGQALLEDHAGVLDEEGKWYVQRIRQASRRMSRLIDDLLGLSQMSRSAIHLERCDLSELARAVVAELRGAQPERDVDVVIAPGLQVHADRTLLRAVLHNLLGNAWKFTAQAPQARIELGATWRDGQAAYFVRDNGAGFDMAYVDKLFHAFQRLHAVDEFEGTGIGLATVKRIIQRHGGEVWAEGKVGAGATFTFSLP